ncbi:ATP-binding protein [Spirulina sp. CCNP1310]|uniref:GAF domain-containing sensor histidine kinase n=1 Tax=Spirulina sp. CCNP1310 TaxID=3110249 RepID=UPI002B2102D8|nr:ATP-binding protein [Spirulina sp. CCNP1310]MEA5419363.1 ATP-binding protein [Spirulina sp. CCNP1310]
MLIPASREFVTLCQSQVTLLAQVLEATWCAVYLTEKWAEGVQPQLHPVAMYPGQGAIAYPPDGPHRLALAPAPGEQPPAHPDPDLALTPPWTDDVFWGQRQLIIPLLHEKLVMGLLVARRETAPWQPRELDQINEIAHSLAIACFLDQKASQGEAKLSQQYRQFQQQRDHFDTLLHQIRNPITALRTFSKLLLKRLQPSDRNYSVAENLVRESDRIQTLLRQFEQWFKAWDAPLPNAANPPALADPGATLALLPNATLQREPLPLATLLPPLIASAQAIAQERGLRLTAPDLWPDQEVWGDAIALQEIVSNLLDNAIKYTPQGGEIYVSTQSTPTEVAIAISDTGFGIPLGDQPRIFERRYRGVQGAGEIPGTGLGLAIAQDLITQMAGRIELISPITNNPTTPGTRFTIWLPRQPSPPTPLPTPGRGE